MLQADILALEHRQEFLEHELIEASHHTEKASHYTELDAISIADIKARVLFLREEIERLRKEAIDLYY